jgi:hypothetical protein
MAHSDGIEILWNFGTIGLKTSRRRSQKWYLTYNCGVVILLKIVIKLLLWNESLSMGMSSTTQGEWIRTSVTFSSHTSKFVLCYFANLIGPVICLLQIQPYCCKDTNPTDVTLHIHKLIILYFVKYQLNKRFFNNCSSSSTQFDSEKCYIW